MQIVTDRGMDLAEEQTKGFNIHYAPLTITLQGKSYRSGVDIQPKEFYQLLQKTDAFPITSQPSAGDFAALYRQLVVDDPDILSIHISSGLSGTVNSARAGAAMVPEANITVVDSKTLSCPLGWQVWAAARAIKAGWPVERIITLLDWVRESSEGMFTLDTLKYLIHGGRISHLKGLLASLLHIRPVIGVEKNNGTYVNYGQERTLKKAIFRLVDFISKWHAPGSFLCVQLLHGNNFEAIQVLHDRLEEVYRCTFLPVVSVAPVLGAHTGPGLVGLAVGPADMLDKLP